MLLAGELFKPGKMTLGPVMVDLRGYMPEADEVEMLRHPLVGGVILFARNYHDPDQLLDLCNSIHKLRPQPLLVAVDHEGGRVQRFHEGFTGLPPCGIYGEIYDSNREDGLELTEQAGWLLAMELLSSGVDFSFAPVLDLDRGISKVIGNRSFHGDGEVVAELAKRFMKGMKTAGMPAVGKHFPGHGSVVPDSHHEAPVDPRAYEDIALSDLLPFERMVNAGIPAIMPAHVIYEAVDSLPAGYSVKWLQGILRHGLGFRGVIFSDDINMEAAGVAGDYLERARAALHAGCDMILVCNNQPAAAAILDQLDLETNPASQARLMRMHGRTGETTLADLRADRRWQVAADRLAALVTEPELALGDDEIRT